MGSVCGGAGLPHPILPPEAAGIAPPQAELGRQTQRAE